MGSVQTITERVIGNVEQVIIANMRRWSGRCLP